MATNRDLWLREATIGSNTIHETDMYQFGLISDGSPRRIVDYGDAMKVNEQHQAGVYYPSFSAGNVPNDNITFRFYPVNGIPDYWMLGKSTTTTGVHKITNFTAGQRPRITTFTQGDYRKYAAYGNIIGSIDFGWVKRSAGLFCTASGKGLAHGTTVHTPNTPALFPSDEDKPFDQFEYFKWNSTAYGIDGFSVKMGQELATIIGDDGAYQEIVETTGPITRAWQVVFAPGVDVSAIIADKTAFTARLIEAKINKSTNTANYWKFYNAGAADAPNTYCIDIRETRITNEPTRYEAVFVSGYCQDLIKDGVDETDAADFYGEVA